MFTDCFNKIFDSSIRVSRFFCKLDGRHSKQLVGAEPCQACFLGTPRARFETTVSRVLLVSVIPIILVLCSCTAYNSGTINLAKIVAHYS